MNGVLLGAPVRSEDDRFVKLFRDKKEARERMDADKENNIGEMMGMLLDSYSDNGLRRLAIKFGKDVLGEYAVQ